MGLIKQMCIESMRYCDSEMVVTRNGTVQRGRSPEPYYETSEDESDLEENNSETVRFIVSNGIVHREKFPNQINKISAELSDVEQSSAEHSEVEQSFAEHSDVEQQSEEHSEEEQTLAELTYAELLKLEQNCAEHSEEEQTSAKLSGIEQSSAEQSEEEQTYAELLELTKTSAEHSDIEQSSAEQSEVEQSSNTESEDSCPIPSTSKEIVFTLKRKMQMTVREDRKKFQPDEKILPNLLIEKVGRQTMVGLDLTAIPIRDLGGRNPRRILMKIISVEEKPSSGHAKLVLWDADASDEEKIQKIMNKPIFIESSWINWYNGFKGMAIPVVEFSREGYKIRKFFG